MCERFLLAHSACLVPLLPERCAYLSRGRTAWVRSVSRAWHLNPSTAWSSRSRPRPQCPRKTPWSAMSCRRTRRRRAPTTSLSPPVRSEDDCACHANAREGGKGRAVQDDGCTGPGRNSTRYVAACAPLVARERDTTAACSRRARTTRGCC